MTTVVSVLAGGGCLVEASAGTGKTRRLVSEIVQSIAAGTDISRIVAVTFTHAAAGSMKIRMRQEIDRVQQLPETTELERVRLRAGLQTLDRAFIGTIHGFCAHLLRQRPVEACIDPDFQELTQPEALSIFSRVFRSWIEERLSRQSPVLKRALTRLAWKQDRSGAGPLDSLREAAWNLAEWRDYDCAWERRGIDRRSLVSELFAKMMEFEELRNACDNPRDPLHEHFRAVGESLARIRRARELGVPNLDEAETEILTIRQRLKRYPRYGTGKYSNTVSREQVVAAWDLMSAEIEEYRVIADADLSSALREELWAVVGEYQKEKARAGQVDFTDLLILARNLLRNPSACLDLQARFDRIFVDEFQDTDPLQSEILLLLCAQREKLFAVGDPKQSIYRFRRADARQYVRTRDRLLIEGLRPDELRSSDRSVDAIQEFVNSAFRESMPGYLELTGGRPAPASQPSVVALPIPNVYGSRNLSGKALSECSPAATAAFIEWLLKSGWTVHDRETQERRPVEERDVCVLFRRFVSYDTDLTQEYVRELEARSIRHVLVGSKSFHQREEIGTIRTALRAIEWPDEELSVFAVLRGTLYAVRDSTLLKFHHRFKRFAATLALPPDLDPEFEGIADAFGLLRDLHRQRNERPIADTLRELLDRTRATAAFAFHHGGERRLANLYRLADLARAFELSGPSSFRSFIEYLEREYESGEQSEAPVLEQLAGGVQLMTVHKAKGLEFPVVVLADLGTHLTRQDGSGRFIDSERGLCAQKLCGWVPWELTDPANRKAEEEEDRAEGLRLAYVAATRARDLLVVSAVGVCEWPESWLSPLYPALYPPKDRWRLAAEHPACRTRGFETVFNQPPERRDEVSIRPGLHQAQSGSQEVYWFDPLHLDLSPRDRESLDHKDLLAKNPEAEGEGLRLYREWQTRREALIRAGSEPRYRVRRATGMSRVPEAETIPLEVIRAEVPAGRPSGRNFGRLVHAILQSGDPAEADRVAAIYGRRWNATDAEIQASVSTARLALAHPALAATSAVELHREWPVSVRLESGEIVEGVVDLAWSDGAAWTVVDYKTGKVERKYQAQLQLYALAIQRGTGMPARAVLLQV